MQIKKYSNEAAKRPDSNTPADISQLSVWVRAAVWLAAKGQRSAYTGAEQAFWNRRSECSAPSCWGPCGRCGWSMKPWAKGCCRAESACQLFSPPCGADRLDAHMDLLPACVCCSCMITAPVNVVKSFIQSRHMKAFIWFKMIVLSAL